jgi:hypothetical protein
VAKTDVTCAAPLSAEGESFDTPAGSRDEIAYVGAERQDRYEHYEWNFLAREVVGTGLQRTDIPMRPLRPLSNAASRIVRPAWV